MARSGPNGAGAPAPVLWARAANAGAVALGTVFASHVAPEGSWLDSRMDGLRHYMPQVFGASRRSEAFRGLREAFDAWKGTNEKLTRYSAKLVAWSEKLIAQSGVLLVMPPTNVEREPLRKKTRRAVVNFGNRADDFMGLLNQSNDEWKEVATAWLDLFRIDKTVDDFSIALSQRNISQPRLEDTDASVVSVSVVRAMLDYGEGPLTPDFTDHVGNATLAFASNKDIEVHQLARPAYTELIARVQHQLNDVLNQTEPHAVWINAENAGGRERPSSVVVDGESGVHDGYVDQIRTAFFESGFYKTVLGDVNATLESVDDDDSEPPLLQTGGVFANITALWYAREAQTIGGWSSLTNTPGIQQVLNMAVMMGAMSGLDTMTLPAQQFASQYIAGVTRDSQSTLQALFRYRPPTSTEEARDQMHALADAVLGAPASDVSGALRRVLVRKYERAAQTMTASDAVQIEEIFDDAGQEARDNDTVYEAAGRVAKIGVIGAAAAATKASARRSQKRTRAAVARAALSHAVRSRLWGPQRTQTAGGSLAVLLMFMSVADQKLRGRHRGRAGNGGHA